MKRDRQQIGKVSYGFAPPMKKRASQVERAIAQPGQSIMGRPVYGPSNRPELKCTDTNVNLTAGNVLATTNTNAGIAVLNAVQQGNGSWNRNGKQIRMKSVRYRMILSATNTNVNDLLQNTIRVTLVYDKQSSSGATPTFDTIFGVTDQTGTESVGSFLDGLRADNTGRFVVLKDDVIDSEQGAIAGANNGEWQCTIDRYIKLKGLITIYSGQSNPCTIADISSGALYLVFRAEVNNGFSRWTVSNSFVRLRYTE